MSAYFSRMMVIGEGSGGTRLAGSCAIRECCRQWRYTRCLIHSTASLSDGVAALTGHRNSPLFGQNSRTNAEGFGKLIEVAFQQMNLASNISSEIAFRYISQPLA